MLVVRLCLLLYFNAAFGDIVNYPAECSLQLQSSTCDLQGCDAECYRGYDMLIYNKDVTATSTYTGTSCLCETLVGTRDSDWRITLDNEGEATVSPTDPNVLEFAYFLQDCTVRYWVTNEEGVCLVGKDACADCSGHGTCAASNTCACDDGWMGPTCADAPPDDETTSLEIPYIIASFVIALVITFFCMRWCLRRRARNATAKLDGKRMRKSTRDEPLLDHEHGFESDHEGPYIAMEDSGMDEEDEIDDSDSSHDETRESSEKDTSGSETEHDGEELLEARQAEEGVLGKMSSHLDHGVGTSTVQPQLASALLTPAGPAKVALVEASPRKVRPAHAQSGATGAAISGAVAGASVASVEAIHVLEAKKDERNQRQRQREKHVPKPSSQPPLHQAQQKGTDGDGPVPRARQLDAATSVCTYRLSILDLGYAKPSKTLLSLEVNQQRVRSKWEWKLWSRETRLRFLRNLTREMGAGTALLLPFNTWLMILLFVLAFASQWLTSVYRYEAETVTKPCIFKELNMTYHTKCPFANPAAFADNSEILQRVAEGITEHDKGGLEQLYNSVLGDQWEDAITAYQYQPVPWGVVLINVPIGFLTMVGFLLVDRFLKVSAKRLERSTIGPSAFACHLQGFPKDSRKTTKAAVHKFARQWGKVDKVIVAKNDSELPELRFQLSVIDSEIERIGFLRLSVKDNEMWSPLALRTRFLTLTDLPQSAPSRWKGMVRAAFRPTEQLSRLHEERRVALRRMRKVQAKLSKDYDCTGDAFVVYRRPCDAEDVDNSLGTISHKIMSMFQAFQTCIRPKYLFADEYPIVSYRCSEPQEIIWDNVKYTWKQRIAFRILGLFKLWSYLVAGVTVSLVGHAIIAGTDSRSTIGWLVSHAVSISVTSIVVMARAGVKKLAGEEGHLTLSAERASAAQNFVLLSIALNVGCAALPYLIIPREWIDPKLGLIPQVTRQVLFAGAVEPVIDLAKGVLKRYATSKISVRRFKSHLQLRTHQLRPTLEVEDVITHIAQLIAVAMAFFPGIPLSITYAFLAAVVANLIVLLRLFVLGGKPRYTSAAIIQSALLIMLFIVYLYACGVALVFLLYRPGNSWLGAIIALIFFFLIAVSLISPWPYALAAAFELALTCSRDNEPKRAPRALFRQEAPVEGQKKRFIPGVAYRASYKAFRDLSSLDVPTWTSFELAADPARLECAETATAVRKFLKRNKHVRTEWVEAPPLIKKTLRKGNEDEEVCSESDDPEAVYDVTGWETESLDAEATSDEEEAAP